MFDDPAQEIADLSAAIKQDIQQLNAGLADLQSLSAAAREGNRHSANHSHSVVDNLRARLKDTAQSFSDVLNVRKENLKVHQGRRQLFSAAADRGEQCSAHDMQINAEQDAVTCVCSVNGGSYSALHLAWLMLILWLKAYA